MNRDLMAQARTTGSGTPVFQGQDDRLSAGAARRRVLIVEDELFVALHFETLIEDLGHEVTALVSTGEDALEEIAAEQPDVILLDVNLGRGLSGVEVAERLRGTGVRIIFITAYADEMNRRRMLDAAPGCLILSKPVSDEVLHRALQTAADPRA